MTKRAVTHLRDLVPDPHNARAHTPKNIGLISDSLRAVGAGRSIVIDEENRILAGNGLCEAAAEAGITKVQVVEADGETVIAVRRIGLTPEQKTKLALYDNRTAELAEWNVDALRDFAAEGLDMKPYEFDAALLEQITGQKSGLTDPDAVPDERPTSIVRGDLFQLGAHRLLCGDSTQAEDVQRVMGGEQAALCLTDPPYGQSQKGVTNDEPEQLREIVSGAVKNLPIENGAAVFFQSPRTFPVLLDEARAHGWTFERMLWLYKAAQCTFPWRGWILKSESILAFSRGAVDWLDVRPYAHDCYYLPEVSGQLPEGSGWHGSVKPLSVVADLLSRIGGEVYDPFLGSGTTLIACEQLGRRCYAIEISPQYVQVAVDRWEAFTGKKAERVG